MTPEEEKEYNKYFYKHPTKNTYHLLFPEMIGKEPTMEDFIKLNKLFISQLLQQRDKELVEKINGMGFKDRNEAGQFALHTDGYNNAIEDVLSLLGNNKKSVII